MRRSFWCIFAFFVCGAALKADVVSIDVFPPKVQLDSSRDRQRIIVQALHTDGRTEDITAAVSVTPTNPSLAAIDRPDGSIIFRPQADGEAVIRVEHAGKTKEIPLKVVSATSAPPLSFRLDVMPVFARAGCNMGSCHGAARGKDGFRLSLFGFDPAGDLPATWHQFWPDWISTRYEQKALREGRLPHYLSFRRNGKAVPEDI